MNCCESAAGGVARWWWWCLIVVTALSGAPGLTPAARGDDELAARAKKLLERSCHPCHGKGERAGADFFVLSPAEAVGIVDEIRKRVFGEGKKRMPPAIHRSIYERKYGVTEEKLEELQLADEDRAVLRLWLDAGAPLGSAPATRELSDDDVISVVHEDVQGVRPSDRPYMRYLSLANLYRAGDKGSALATYRVAIRKLLNSLSWRAEPVEVVTLPGAKEMVLRFDLRHMLRAKERRAGRLLLEPWGREVWDCLAGRYPYALPLLGPQAVDLQDELGTPLFLLRADWFAFETTRPPLYNELLGLPRTTDELGRLLDVDVTSNIRSGTARRAGTTDSGVSSNHRIIERHPLEAWNGAYWVSYDFRKPSIADRSSILDFPRGPGSGPGFFQHAGGEFIFSLPNGLQGYFLSKANGEALESAPTDIVQNRHRADAVVLNGISCMGCHETPERNGMINVKAQLRAFVEATVSSANVAVWRAVKRLYPGNEAINRWIDADRRRFEAALERVGVKPVVDEEGRAVTEEPVSRLVRRFERKVDFRNAAAELDMTAQQLNREFNSPLLRRNPTMRRLSSRLKYTSVSREEFIEEFRRLARQFFGAEPGRVKVPGTRPGGAGVTLSGKDFTVEGIEIDMVWVRPGRFTMGSPRGEDGRHDHETRHEVRLTQGFWLGKYEVTQRQYESLMGENPSHFENAGKDAPVETVSWNEAMEFFRRLTERERKAGRLPADEEYTLPSEAQWEYACRAGTEGARYRERLRAIAWYEDNSGSTTHPVGQKTANAFGLHDMLGNVYEWCFDVYAGYPKGSVVDPEQTAAGGIRVYRGGGWRADAEGCRAAIRLGSGPTSRYFDLGFRLARRSVRE
ncbi:MAG: SUMF1/EgtB/PvdO family nonheme iron enzyme [Planctomycetota bacterium]|nr:SUMF1/EgtB/PvdO family nonheme iron enzyme [Planctomycetota bacterium]